jgi:hypothetical protein
MGHHFYGLNFCLDEEFFLLYIVWALCFLFIIKFFLIESFLRKFVIFSSTWNVNVFKVSNPFHVYK